METVSSALSVHPAANEFPMLSEDRLRELADDITINGQREAIKLFDGMVIDGRNRYAACVLAGVEPRTETLPDGIDPWAYVWSLNGQRRDITADQRYLIWKSCSEQSAAWQAQQQRIQDEANRKRAESAQARPRHDDGTLAPSSASTSSGQTGHTSSPRGQGTAAKAAASHTNRGAVERMDQLARERPDLAEQVKAGALPGAAAIREMKREAVVQRLEDIGAKEAKAAAEIERCRPE